MIAPRTTRLVRVSSLKGFRQALLSYADADVAAMRGTAIIVPTHAAGEQLRRGFESSSQARSVVVLPHVLTRGDWVTWLVHHVPSAPSLLSSHEREVLLGAAAREASDAGSVPPFRLRAALVGEMLAFYDTFRRQLKTIDDFERLATARFERDADEDLGAARMLAQARFMLAAFRGYERTLDGLGRADEHLMRARLLDEPDTPVRRVVVSVGDRAADPFGLWIADFDLLARINGLTQVDIVATDAALAAGLLQRLHEHVPGFADTRFEPGPDAEPESRPVLDVPSGDSGALFHHHRDREDELAWVARRAKCACRSGGQERLDRTAVVFKRPLPYVYLASRTFPAAGLPYETVDSLPLASEPAAAALDLVVEIVGTAFARTSLVALLRSPHFRFESGGQWVTPAAVALLDRELSEARYLGDPAELARLANEWGRTGGTDDGPEVRRNVVLARAGAAAVAVASELARLAVDDAPSAHLDVLREFLQGHDRMSAADDDVRQRHLRARGAVMATLTSLRDAFRAFDDRPRPFAETASTVHRWIERQTFAPHAGGGGVVVTDAHAARYGAFDTVYLVGLTEREWPDSPRRSIFFPGSMLKDLGWPDEADSRASERAAFSDLLRLATTRVAVSTFTLEDDAIVEPSPFLEDLAESKLDVSREGPSSDTRVFLDEALATGPVRDGVFHGEVAEWLALRLSRTAASDSRYHGQVQPGGPGSYRVSALDRYIDCPFVFFAEAVLRIKEEPEDEEGLSPRAQGRVLHEVFEAFFREWQDAGHGAIVPGNLDEARQHFAAAVDARLAAMPEGDAAIERMRLLGSPVAPGMGDIVLGIEAGRATNVVERLLEFSLNGEAELRAPGGMRRIALRAKADRIDLMADGTFRVFDYKLSKPPDTKSAVQLPAYAAAARTRLDGHLGRSWRASDVAYMAFGKAPYYKPLAADDDKLDAVLADGEGRLVAAVDRIERGVFPPRPHHTHQCSYCPFASVCRKDYVVGD